MGVQLNIKDARAADLARDLAAKLGKSVTEVVREALEEKTRRRDEEIDRIVREALALTEGSRNHWNPEFRHATSREIMDSIYDEEGLPA